MKGLERCRHGLPVKTHGKGGVVKDQQRRDWCASGTPPNYQGNGYVTFDNLTLCKNMTAEELTTLQTNPSPPSAPLISALWRLACDGGPLDNIAFPIPRPAPADEETVTQLLALQEGGAFLGQSIPNPGQDKVIIPVLLPMKKGRATLEIFDLATGKLLESRPLLSGGQHMVEIITCHMPSGMYGYRVVLGEGKSPQPRKMVILR